jgi:Rhs element Vgr protein
MTDLSPITKNTDLVSFQIVINGEQIPQTFPVFSLEISHEVNRIASATLRLSDGDVGTGEWTISSGDHFVPGNEIELLAGYHGEDVTLFSGIVIRQALKVRSRQLALEVECRHKAVEMTSSRKSRQFSDMADHDVIMAILDEYGLTADVETMDVTHQQLVQYDCTDWDFLVSRAEANGRVLATTLDGIHLFKPLSDSDPLTTLQFGGNIIEFDAEIDARMQYGAVSAQAWNATDQEVVVLDAVDPAWETAGDLQPNVLAQATGRAQITMRDAAGLSQDETQVWADNALLRSRMAFVRGRARIKGQADVEPGMMMELAGFGNRFNGVVWVSAVRHEIGYGSWLTDIQFGLENTLHTERFPIHTQAGASLLAGMSGLHTGVVASLEGDPDGEGRIQVKIPSVSLDENGVWCRVATLDAGADRGTFFLPEVDDEVVIGFLNDDPRHGIVLGMLHSSANPAPLEPADTNSLKGYVSRSGLRVEFDDEKSAMNLSTPSGKTVVMDEDAGEILIADENNNSFELSASGIKLSSAGDIEINASGNLLLEGGINLEAKAGAQNKIEGSAGAEVKSSGITVIKGSVVQIN